MDRKRNGYNYLVINLLVTRTGREILEPVMISIYSSSILLNTKNYSGQELHNNQIIMLPKNIFNIERGVNTDINIEGNLLTFTV